MLKNKANMPPYYIGFSGMSTLFLIFSHKIHIHFSAILSKITQKTKFLRTTQKKIFIKIHMKIRGKFLIFSKTYATLCRVYLNKLSSMFDNKQTPPL